MTGIYFFTYTTPLFLFSKKLDYPINIGFYYSYQLTFCPTRISRAARDLS